MNEAEKQLKANQLAGYERTSAVIWMITSILQIISVVFIVAGVWNLIASLSSFDTEKKILNRDADVPNIFQDIYERSKLLKEPPIYLWIWLGTFFFVMLV